MNRQTCPVCGIIRDNGVFYFSYKNTPTTPEDVAGLICSNIQKDPHKVSLCINSCKDFESGDNFKKRSSFTKK